MLSLVSRLRTSLQTSAIFARQKVTIDYSRVPIINESDIEENFVRGSGPGGQAVNTASNCVLLKHIPSGIVVRCHESRSLDHNRKIARDRLITQVDNWINGDKSVMAQKEIAEKIKGDAVKRRRKAMQQRKKEWKEKQGLD